jgi:hypothetical protein
LSRIRKNSADARLPMISTKAMATKIFMTRRGAGVAMSSAAMVDGKSL